MDPYGPSTVPAGAVVSRGPVARWLWELEARSPVASTSSRAAMAARRPRCSRARAAVSGTQGMAPICSVTATLSVSYSSVSRVFSPARMPHAQLLDEIVFRGYPHADRPGAEAISSRSVSTDCADKLATRRGARSPLAASLAQGVQVRR
ncbi:Uncharacterised protein [Nocardia brasiliensis]|nr:Uncharacterised protein [Nocardia brasiliensis]